MKLLIIYHSGLADDAKHIFREYVRQGVELTVIVPEKNGSLAYGPAHYEKEFAYVALPFHGRFNFTQLLQAVKKTAPDVIHVFDEFSSIVLFQAVRCRNALYGKNIPVFSLSFQNMPLRISPAPLRSPIAFLRRLVYKLSVPFMVRYHRRNVAGVVCGNSDALAVMKSLSPRTPVKLIYWGVNIGAFFVQDKRQCRKKLKLPQHATIIGYFGKMYREKGLENLVRAAGMLEGAHLLLVGNGAYRNKLQQLAVELGMQERVLLRDAVRLEELCDYYNALDAYVLPTYTTPDVKEQYGRVLIEAMACHVPVVGSTCGAIPEVLKDYPACRIFDEYSLDGLVLAIKEALALTLPEPFDAPAFLHRFSIHNFVGQNIALYRHGN